jgi:hypothetical protein
MDIPISFEKYLEVLLVMRDAGLLDKEWVKKTGQDGRAYLRKPGVKKKK